MGEAGDTRPTHGPKTERDDPPVEAFGDPFLPLLEPSSETLLGKNQLWTLMWMLVWTLVWTLVWILVCILVWILVWILGWILVWLLGRKIGAFFRVRGF